MMGSNDSIQRLARESTPIWITRHDPGLTLERRGDYLFALAEGRPLTWLHHGASERVLLRDAAKIVRRLARHNPAALHRARAAMQLYMEEA